MTYVIQVQGLRALVWENDNDDEIVDDRKEEGFLYNENQQKTIKWEKDLSRFKNGWGRGWGESPEQTFRDCNAHLSSFF